MHKKFKLTLVVTGLVVGGLCGCKNNSATSPNADHPIDFVVGQFGTEFNDLNAPLGICVDGSDNVYVADYGNNRIKQYNSSGVCQMTWSGATASGTNVQDAINHPYGLAFYGGNILEVDNGNSTTKIQEFSTAGLLLNQWGGPGAGAGDFNVPTWIGINPSNDIYVADSDNNRVQFFTGPGVLGGTLGTSGGSALGQYDQAPTGIAFDASGNAYVGDLGNHRIEVFDSTGAPVSTWGAGDFSAINGLTFDHEGNLLAVDTGAREILKFDPAGNLIDKWSEDTLAAPIDAVVDSTGAIWVTYQSTSLAFLVKYAH